MYLVIQYRHHEAMMPARRKDSKMSSHHDEVIKTPQNYIFQSITANFKGVYTGYIQILKRYI